ncbi:AAA family ATPase [Dietzia natronolimnaea]|uniref:AAA family ATPase n=1 Tax=Dietzia natronolimnaea TaxID=161920 RepID=UPI0015FAF040|nr:AAA family ATPase [Dietzia natronolimnaea]MBB1037835.1 AAA family ATPase [Dietzia natronolimnaea]
MLGSTRLTLVFGAAPGNTSETAVMKGYVRALADAGLSVLFIKPRTKYPDDLRSSLARKKDEKAGQDKSGLYLATKDKATLARYVEAYRKRHGDDAPINLAVHPGRSRYVVIDADTLEEVASWISWWTQATGEDMTGVPPTVTTPGAKDDDGNWKHQGGGHWYLRLPDGFEVSEGTPAKVKVGTATAYVGDCYVLIPPSTRPEGVYTMTGTDYPAPQALLDLLVPTERAAKKERDRTPTPPPVARERATQAPESDGLVSLEDWLNDTPWAEILDGWTPYSTDKCGCPTWTAPGLHDSPKSAVTHECPGHSDGGRLHVWSDNPQTGTALDDQVAAGRKSFSKLQATAWMHHEGDVSAAMGALGIDRSTVKSGGGLLERKPGTPPSWAPMDLTKFLAEDYQPPMPELLPRADGVCLFYKGRTHSVHGETESGKSLLVQVEAVAIMAGGGRVLYIDFEDSPAGVIGRLRDYGATTDQIADGLHYVRPESSPSAMADEEEAFHALLAGNYDLVVIDGVTAALAFADGDSPSNSGDAVIAWQKSVPNRLADRTGAAVVVIDHVGKSKDSRGRMAIGSQMKIAGLSGSSFYVDVKDALGRGLVGRTELYLGKDRPGGLSPLCGPMGKDRLRHAATVVFDATVTPNVMELLPPDMDSPAVLHTDEEMNKPGVLDPQVFARFDLQPGQAAYVTALVCTLDDEGLTEATLAKLWGQLAGHGKSITSTDLRWKEEWNPARKAKAVVNIRGKSGRGTRERPDRDHPWSRDHQVVLALEAVRKARQITGEEAGG